MGADINFYVEKYNKESNKWEYIYILDKDKEIIDWYPRDYDLFGILANVRGEVLRGFTQEKGLPETADPAILKEYDCGYFYGATWYTMSELLIGKKFLELKIREQWLKYKLTCEDIETIEEIEYTLASFNNFISLVDMVAYYNAAYDSDNIRVIVWFDD